MVVSRDIPVIYVPSWRNRLEPTHKALFFHARRRLQGEPRWQSTEVIRKALEPFWMRMNSREETGVNHEQIAVSTCTRALLQIEVN